jgi:hypothetical protein
MTEDKYKKLFDDYLTDKSGVDDFIDRFMNQWRADRGKKKTTIADFKDLLSECLQVATAILKHQRDNLRWTKNN